MCTIILVSVCVCICIELDTNNAVCVLVEYFDMVDCVDFPVKGDLLLT